MNLQEILAILIPLFGLLGWIYSRIDKKFEQVFAEFAEVKKSLHSLDMRLTRLEGRFDERG